MTAETSTVHSYDAGSGSGRLREMERLERQAELTFDCELRLMLEHGLSTSGVVVDVGSGSGAVTERLRRALPDAVVHGADVDPTLLAMVAPPTRLIENGRLPFEGGEVDSVVVRFVAQHLSPAQRTELWSEVLRVLRPGGTAHVVDVDDSAPGDTSRPLMRGLVEVFLELHRLQAARGGDRMVARRVPGELRDAGFADVTPERGEVTTHDRPLADFAVHLGPERYVPLVAAGALTVQQLAAVGHAWEQLRRDPEAFVRVNVHTVHARRPDSEHDPEPDPSDLTTSS